MKVLIYHYHLGNLEQANLPAELLDKTRLYEGIFEIESFDKFMEAWRHPIQVHPLSEVYFNDELVKYNIFICDNGRFNQR